jgi:hypothetical protein
MRHSLLGTIENALNLELARIVLQSSDYECLIGMVNKAISLMLEHPDAVKDETSKSTIIDILCLCVSRHEKGPRSGEIVFSHG